MNLSPSEKNPPPDVNAFATDYVRSSHKVFQGEFTIVVKVIPEKKEALRNFLEPIGQNTSGNPHISFGAIKSMHYCRWFILDEARDVKDNLLPPMLCFSTVYDGSLDHHLKEWFLVAAAALDEIYRCCIGYPLSGSEQKKIDWLKKYRHKEKLFWAAKIGATHEIILKENELYEKIQDFVNLQYQKDDLAKVAPRDLYERIRNFVSASPNLNWAMKPVAGPSFLAVLRNIYWLLSFIVFMCFLIPLLIIWVPLMFYFEKRDNRNYVPIPPKPISSVVNPEDKYFQNHLTIYGTLKSPGWFKINNLRLYLAFASKLMRYRATKGNLSGISTIHFVSYVMFEGGRNTMFLSNYDGGWESYLNEFIDKAASVMNLSFGNFKGYPKMKNIIHGGAHDEQTFKTIVRQYQYPCQVWYTAYPTISISNILNNSAIRKGLSASMNEDQLKVWLRLL